MAGVSLALNPVSLTLCRVTTARPDAGIRGGYSCARKADFQIQTVSDAEEALIKLKAL
jgi:hypothetical protein